ncbi:MAG: hypothetical protein NZ556_08020 [Fimbriimonadales bacterium]|nr:hypothetical protein [Fimbriimonadales bacterium]
MLLKEGVHVQQVMHASGEAIKAVHNHGAHFARLHSLQDFLQLRAIRILRTAHFVDNFQFPLRMFA